MSKRKYGTKENGYILDYELYDGRSIITEEFKTLHELRKYIENKASTVKNHLIWYNITKKVEAGTYTDKTFFKQQYDKCKHNYPEPRIGDERLRR